MNLRVYPKKWWVVLLPFFTTLHSFGQLKQIDHHAYDDWKKLEKQKASRTGSWISYEINPLKGDGFLYFYNQTSAKLDSIQRGKDASISFQEDFIAYKLTPGYDTLRSCELKKSDKKKWPKDTLCIFLPAKDSTLKRAGTKYPLRSVPAGWGRATND